MIDAMPFAKPLSRSNSPISEATEYALDQDAAFDHQQVLDVGLRWQEPPHAQERSRGYVVLAGERLVLPWLTLPADAMMLLEWLPGLEQISSDGLTIDVSVETSEGRSSLLSVPVVNQQVRGARRRLQCSLPYPPGTRLRLEVSIGAGPAGDPCADWVALLNLLIARVDRIELLRAAGQRAWRIRNEIAHFENVYSGKMYASRPEFDAQAGTALAIHRARGDNARQGQGLTAAQLLPRLAGVVPNPGESAYAYASRLLGSLMPGKPPDFAERLRSRAGAPLRMLSLCCGEAGIEGSLLQQSGVAAEVTLFDINDVLLRRAAGRLPPSCRIELVQGDINELDAFGAGFEVVVLVAGLHHVVEVERVLRAVSKMLTPDGEFWLIGEQIGRNGSRLWPDAHERADSLFRSLPPAYRHNAGRGRIDDRLPDVDCSTACFEGIRSEELLGLLLRQFEPVEMHMRNCFLWRLVDAAYCDNYDLEKEADRALVQGLVAEEFVFWMQGGRPTELNGAFRARAVRSA